MAVLTPRLVLVCTVPAVVTLLTIFWTRRRRKIIAVTGSSTKKAPLASTQETLINKADGASQTSENEVLKDNATTSSDNLEVDQVSSLIPEVIDCVEESCISQRAAISVESQAHEYRPSVCVQGGNICPVSELSDLESVVEIEVSRDRLSLTDDCIGEELQSILPNMHIKFDDNFHAAKIEQDCPLSPEVSSVGVVCSGHGNSEEHCCVDDDQVVSKDCHLSEESRDSAMGGEEDFAVVESSFCSVLESTQTASDSPARTECQEKLFEPEGDHVDESAESECLNELDEILESPPHSIYSEHSEGSCDSGKGGSDIHIISSTEASQLGENALLIYEFEIPQDLCGRLIGRSGKHVNSIKSRCNANVFIKRHPFNSKLKLCAIQGTKSEILNALDLIRKRFPRSQFPAVTLVQVNIPLGCGVIVPETLQLNLPEGVTCDVILSSMVSAGHFFIQQPTHPTYPSLNRLDMCMTTCYTQLDTPQIPHPVKVGVICACPVLEGWFRAQVVNLLEDSEECDIKFVDYGGYSCVPLSRLRQIRSDFMTLPFQASECYLANVTPASESWSSEACTTFEELAQGQILQALVVGHAEDGIPYVHLYRVQGVSTVFINRELVNRGVARWLEAES